MYDYSISVHDYVMHLPHTLHIASPDHWLCRKNSGKWKGCDPAFRPRPIMSALAILL